MSERGRPRDLLWYHQLQKENRHLLDRLNSQESDMDKLKVQLSASERYKAESEQVLAEVRAGQRTALERSREGFEREKEILKRVNALEASFKSHQDGLKEDEDKVSTQLVHLEQRVKVMEAQQSGRASLEVTRLSERLQILEEGIRTQAVSTEKCLLLGKQDQPQYAQKADMTTTETKKVEGDKITTSLFTESKVAENDQTVKETTFENRASSKASTTSKTAQSDSVGSNKTKRQGSELEPWPVLLQKKRRRSREIRVPFRPAPLDMYW